MKRLLIGALAVALVPFAAAQDKLFELGAASLRIGGVYPFEDATRQVTGNMMSVGLDLEFGPGLLPGARTYVSLDWFGKSTALGKGNMIPVMLNQRMYFGQAMPGDPQFYGYFGVGFVSIDVYRSEIVWGARAGAGAQLSERLFVETGLTYSDAANGARANSVGLWFGYRL
jgi:hypothetical protein